VEAGDLSQVQSWEGNVLSRGPFLASLDPPFALTGPQTIAHLPDTRYVAGGGRQNPWWPPSRKPALWSCPGRSVQRIRTCSHYFQQLLSSNMLLKGG
jgi:hypothetical protein